MKAILYKKSIPRFVWTRFVARLGPGWALGPGSMVSLGDVDAPDLPGPDWVRVRPRLSGVCGSDVATIRGRSTPYFSPLISAPFVLGHEIVGTIEETGTGVDELSHGDRVVVEPALHCAVRGLDSSCKPCQGGDTGRCERTMEGEIAPGIQTGYCRSTGGGWGTSLVAHRLQCHKVPKAWDDEAAVLIEPLSCALHAVATEPPAEDETALVIGCGTIGLLLIAAARTLGHKGPILASARWDHQKEWAMKLGATETVPTGLPLYEEIARRTGGRVMPTEMGPPVLTGGVGLVYDCVASGRSINQAIRLVRPGGRVVLVGMPGIPFGVDWSAIWHRELIVRGVYAYGAESIDGKRRRTFDVAFELMKERAAELAPMVTNRFPLEDYRAALRIAMTAGKSKAVKVVFTNG
ncbi:MAG: alcohol dehydrogenase catalytic domain-containing protein [Planctomycetota bacterium]|nr:alcohol dehydrogenase catalytic domain-containing protein [Planctomycetota bacterium]